MGKNHANFHCKSQIRSGHIRGTHSHSQSVSHTSSIVLRAQIPPLHVNLLASKAEGRPQTKPNKQRSVCLAKMEESSRGGALLFLSLSLSFSCHGKGGERFSSFGGGIWRRPASGTPSRRLNLAHLIIGGRPAGPNLSPGFTVCSLRAQLGRRLWPALHTMRQKYGDKFLCSAAQKCNPIFDAQCTPYAKSALCRVHCAERTVNAERAPSFSCARLRNDRCPRLSTGELALCCFEAHKGESCQKGAFSG